MYDDIILSSYFDEFELVHHMRFFIFCGTFPHICLRRWPNISPTLGQRLVFAGMTKRNVMLSGCGCLTAGVRTCVSYSRGRPQK